MRLVELPTVATIVLDICAWFLIHMGVSKAITSLPEAWFNTKSWIYRRWRWENSGRVYETVFSVKTWKSWLPDAAPWFKGGFPKKDLSSVSPEYLQRFVRETCRGELAHWVTLGVSPVFFLWNQSWVGWLMISYALVANLPCLVVQRYNRIRLSSLLEKMMSGVKPGAE